jgi:hypothetical protein
MNLSRKLLLFLVAFLALAQVPVVLGGDDDAADDAAADDASGADDNYVDLSDEDFDQVSVMPVSCVN